MIRTCERCKLIVLDDAVVCPLCRGVLSETKVEDEAQDENSHKKEKKKEQSHVEGRSLTYPDILPRTQKLRFVIRLVIFTAILVEMALIVINYVTNPDFLWSLIVGAALVYGCFTLDYSVKEHRSTQRRLLVQMIVFILLVLVMDWYFGKQGWSYSFAVPIALMGVDLAAVILMLVNVYHWQNYVMTEIVTFLISLLFIILMMVEVVPDCLLLIISGIVTGVILLGTVLIGERPIANELKRRFRV